MTHHNVHPSYRADIDGLRAIAVIPVIAFHAVPAWVPGGFVGVDIFFVISGFLISTIVFSSLDSGSFSFADFYARRVRRIFPALVVVLAAVWLAGQAFLFPIELENLGRHVAAGAAFVSNFALWRDVGYFDSGAETKPLLHLWSLAIEEQFYLVWPVALVVTWRFARIRFPLIIAAGALSFALCAWLTARDPVAAYYFPVSRFWELLLGAVLAYARAVGTVPRRGPAAPLPRWLREGGAVAGLVLITGSLFVIDQRAPFPGWRAIAPAGGALLLIWAGPATLLNRRLLAAPLLVEIGLISYPLYLWHWPMLVFMRKLSPGSASGRWIMLAVAASFLAAWLTFRFIEHPLRTLPRNQTVRWLGAAMTACLAVGIATHSAVIRGRLDTPYIVLLAKAERDWEYPGTNDRPLGVGTGAPDVLFVGDSHMQQYYPRVRWLIEERGARAAEFLTRSGCPPLPGLERIDGAYDCGHFLDTAVAHALAHPEIRTVVIGAAWENYFLGIPPPQTARGPLLRAAGRDNLTAVTIDDATARAAFEGLAASIRTLRAAGKRVLVILNNPTSGDYAPATRYPDRLTGAAPPFKRSTSRHDFETFAKPVVARVTLAARMSGATVIDPAETLCIADSCPTVDAGDAPVYMDSNHIRASYAREFATYIDSAY